MPGGGLPDGRGENEPDGRGGEEVDGRGRGEEEDDDSDDDDVATKAGDVEAWTAGRWVETSVISVGLMTGI